MSAFKSARIIPSLLASALLVACNSGGGGNTGVGPDTMGKKTVPNACSMFTEDIAALLGTAPFDPPSDNTVGTVSMCQRISDKPVIGVDQGTYARIELVGSLDAFQKYSCTAPSDTSYGKFEFTKVDGIGEAACEVKWGSIIGVTAYQNGYAVQVGNSTREKCIQALNKMLPKLPK